MRDLERLLSSATSFIAPATVVAALVCGASAGLAPGLLILAGGVLLGAVLLFWSSLGRLTGESPLTLEEAVGLAAPSPEEERKRSILRALKDLDYERSVGKLSDEDFAELSTRYRTEAKALLRSLEAELAPRREKAEAKLKARLETEGVLGEPGRAKSKPAKSVKKKAASPREPEPPNDAALPDDGEGPPSESKSELPGTGDASGTKSGTSCPACQTMNDDDARFCKRCGATLEVKATEP